MFTIMAPYPSAAATVLLPNPQLGNSEGLAITMTRKVAIDGTIHTYIKRKQGRRVLKWTFKLTRNKALELRAFIQCYFASAVKITDHNSRVWVGNFTGNPFEFETVERSGPAISPMPRGESVRIELQFEGVEQ
jgi:hypothetical protein